jgi:hypothetical protein
MRRREFITLLGSGAGFLAARYSCPSAGPPVIGLLQMGTPSAYDLSGFRQGFDLFHRVVPKAAGFLGRSGAGQSASLGSQSTSNEGAGGLLGGLGGLGRRRQLSVAWITAGTP